MERRQPSVKPRRVGQRINRSRPKKRFGVLQFALGGCLFPLVRPIVPNRSAKMITGRHAVRRLVVAVVILCPDLGAQTGPKRAYRINDQFEVESIDRGSISFSPDGRSFVFTRRRPASTAMGN